LKPGVKLPGERDAAPFDIAPQPPEGKAIDVLNIFDDGSQQDLSGTMTSTTLRGFGMAKDLTFAGAFFGEPPTFPGGISFGSIAFDGTNFVTDGAKSSIEVVNLLLGQGNDSLDVQGTLDPDDPVVATGLVTIVGGAAGGTVSRPGFDWTASGFTVGQDVTLYQRVGNAWQALGTWKVTAITGSDG